MQFINIKEYVKKEKELKEIVAKSTPKLTIIQVGSGSIQQVCAQ